MQKIALALLAIALAYSTIIAISEQAMGLYALVAVVSYGIWRVVRHKPANDKTSLSIQPALSVK